MEELPEYIDRSLLNPAFGERHGRGQKMSLKEDSTQSLREFAKIKEVAAAIKKVVPLKDRIIIFGDIRSEWQPIRNLLDFIPLAVDRSEVSRLIIGYVTNILKELDIKAENGLSNILLQMAYRNLINNCQILYSEPGFLEAHPLDPISQAIASVRAECEATLAEMLADDDDDDDDEDSFGDDNYPDDDDDTEDINYDGMDDPEDGLSSYKELVAHALKLSTDPNLDEETKLGILLVKLSSAPELSDHKTLSAMGVEATNKAWDFLRKLDVELRNARQLVSEYINHGELTIPERRVGIPIDVAAQTCTPVEAIRNMISRKGTAAGMMPESLKGLNLTQVHTGLVRLFLKVACSPYVRAAQRLSFTLGRQMLKSKMFEESEKVENTVYLDSYGNVIHEESRLKEIIEMRRIQIYNGRTGQFESLEIFWPDKAMRPKEETSIVGKLIREPQLTIDQLFDLWGGNIMVNYRSKELLDDDVKRQTVVQFGKQLFAEVKGMRFWEDIKKDTLKAGQYTIVDKLATEAQSGKSLGHPTIKIYFRTPATEEVPKGVPGEIQILPRDTWENMRSIDHPSHHVFYDAKKVEPIVRHLFSDSLFEDLHREANYIADGLAIIQGKHQDSLAT